MDDETKAPLVSGACSAYNQERYIAETLEGFVRQKTNFPFEIVVHDHASSDSTPVFRALSWQGSLAALKVWP